jgi:hypothetical protein
VALTEKQPTWVVDFFEPLTLYLWRFVFGNLPFPIDLKQKSVGTGNLQFHMGKTHRSEVLINNETHERF